jgi:putative ABC transport system permease protein
MGNYFPIFNLAPETIYLDCVLSLIVGILAGILPTWRAARIRIADGLRMIE